MTRKYRGEGEALKKESSSDGPYQAECDSCYMIGQGEREVVVNEYQKLHCFGTAAATATTTKYGCKYLFISWRPIHSTGRL